MEKASFTQKILDLLLMEFPNSRIEFDSPRKDGRHFELTIQSKRFQNLNRIERSRLVYSILDEYIGTDLIHAISMKLISPNE